MTAIVRETTAQVKALRWHDSKAMAERFQDTDAHVVWCYLAPLGELAQGQSPKRWTLRSAWVDYGATVEGQPIVVPHRLGGRQIDRNLEIFWLWESPVRDFRAIRASAGSPQRQI